MFRCKKYRALRPMGLQKDRLDRKSPRARRRKGINPQSPKALTKRIDLARGARLGGFLAVLGELRAPKCRVALEHELCDFRGPRRRTIALRPESSKKLIDAVGTAAHAEALVQLPADINARRRPMRCPKRHNDGDDLFVRELLGSSHPVTLR
jgi:hypothetical protein